MAPAVSFIRLCTDVTNEFLDRNGPYMAAAVSFYALFSLFPLLLALIAISGFLLGSETFQSRLIEGLPEFLPVEGDFVSSVLGKVTSGRAVGSVLASLGLFWASTAVFGAIRKSINNIWGIRKTRPFLQERLMDVTLMLGASMLLLVSVFTTTFLSFFSEIMTVLLPEGAPTGAELWSRLAVVVPPITSFVTFFVLYLWLPNTRVRTRDAWLPALVASAAFEIAKVVFVLYMANFRGYDDVYGAVGAVIALMAWVYVSTIILLVGASLTSRYAEFLARQDQRRRLELLASSLERVRTQAAVVAPAD